MYRIFTNYWGVLGVIIIGVTLGVLCANYSNNNLIVFGAIIILFALYKLLIHLKNAFNIFLCVVISIPYDTLLNFRLNVGGVPLNLLDFLIIPVIFELISNVKKNKIKYKLSPTFIFFLFFITFGFLMGIIFNNPIALVIRETRFYVYTAIMALGVLIKAKKDGYKGMTDTFVIGSIFSSIFQFSGIANYSGSLNSVRLIHVMTNFIPLGFSLLLSHPKYDLYNKSLRKVKYPLLLLMLGAIIISMTRGVWIEFILMQLIMVFFMKGQRLYIIKQHFILFCVSIVPLVIIISTIGLDSIYNSLSLRFQSIFDPLSNNNTINYRFSDSTTQFENVMGNGYWLTGYGFGNQMQSVNMIGFAGVDQSTNTDYTENSYLYYLWKSGVLGLLIPLFMFIIPGISLIFRSIKISEPENKFILISFGSLILSMAASTAFSGALAPSQNLIICGAVIGVWLKQREEKLKFLEYLKTEEFKALLYKN